MHFCGLRCPWGSYWRWMRFIQQQHKQELGNLIELKEGGQLICTICGKRNVTEDEQSARRVCFCVCVWKTQRESVFVTCFLSGFYCVFSVNWDFSLLSNISRGAWQRCQTCSLLITTLSHIWAFWVMGLFAFLCWWVIGDVSVLE